MTALRDQISAAMDLVDQPIARAFSLPAPFYTDPAIFELERKALFLSDWVLACRADQVAQPGDYHTLNTAGGPVIVIHGHDGTVRAFANVCRHRGSILLEGVGRCTRIVCPYHAWSYHTDGRLASAPDMESTLNFNADGNGLIPLGMETWAGFIFVTYNENPTPLRTHLGDFPDRMASHRLDDMRHVWSTHIPCACNWKLLLENAMETYHTGLVHRDTVGTQTSRDIETIGEWLCIQVMSGRSIATLPDAPPPFPIINGLDDEARKGTYFTIILPTCQLVMAQDCLWWLNVVPIAVDKSILEISGCFPEDTIKLPNFDALAAPYFERWEKVGHEDVGILERQQRGLGSVLHQPGRLSHRDEQVRALNLWVLKKLQGHTP